MTREIPVSSNRKDEQVVRFLYVSQILKYKYYITIVIIIIIIG